jgi:predicted DNA-binding transcriptional regulator AlpA
MESHTERLFSLTETAELLNIPVSWLYERSRRNALPGMVRLGKYVRIREDGIQELMRGEKHRGRLDEKVLP